MFWNSNDMFCYQCEQKAKDEACTGKKGVCGKDNEVAALQDLLVHMCKGISMYAHRARDLGASDEEVDAFVEDALFATLTNTNFDADRFGELIKKSAGVKDRARRLYEQACSDAGQEPEQLSGPAQCEPSGDVDDLVKQGRDVSIEERINQYGEDVAGLQECAIYGIKGAAAYAHHARVLDETSEQVSAGFHRLINAVAEEPTDTNELLQLCLDVGEFNLNVMELLDSANTGAFGHPEPTEVPIEPREGKAIVVSGHDLKDLKALLEQTEGTGINVYTHGEMLPAHGYPELKQYDHLVGNYGGAWQDQRSEFDQFPGAILMTTNCITSPRDSYQDRIFTSGPTGWPGVTHITDGDFSPVIEAAKAQPGFSEDGSDRTIPVGFGHNAVTEVADDVVGAVQNGDIRHFFLIGGCDGAKSGRNYYTELAEQVPDDCMILTLACGKYRFNKMDFGEIGGLPRMLDIGQCNDSYSAIRIAQALSDAFDCGVNDLPLSFVVSWYEQKAVAILLTLLHLGIQDIRLGPTLPAFTTEPVLGVLQDKFNIKPIGEPQEDLEAMLA